MPWIKIDVDFPDHPKVKIIAEALDIDREMAAGLMVRWFCWVRKYCQDGNVQNLEFELPGKIPENSRKFREALVDTGFIRSGWVNKWPEYGGSEIAEKAKREPDKFKEMIDFYDLLPYGKKTGKKREKNGLEEKRREESKPSISWDAFCSIYPKKIGKGAAEKAFNKIHLANGLLDLMIAAVKEQAQSEQWRKDGGQYIPNPATWLNQKRWMDVSGIQIAEPKQITMI